MNEAHCFVDVCKKVQGKSEKDYPRVASLRLGPYPYAKGTIEKSPQVMWVLYHVQNRVLWINRAGLERD